MGLQPSTSWLSSSWHRWARLGSPNSARLPLRVCRSRQKSASLADGSAQRASWALVSRRNAKKPLRSCAARSSIAISSRCAVSLRARMSSSVMSETTIKSALVGAPIARYSMRSWRPSRSICAGSCASTMSTGIRWPYRLSKPSCIQASRSGVWPSRYDQIRAPGGGAPNQRASEREPSPLSVPSSSTVTNPGATLSRISVMSRLRRSSSAVRRATICSRRVSASIWSSRTRLRSTSSVDARSSECSSCRRSSSAAAYAALTAAANAWTSGVSPPPAGKALRSWRRVRACMVSARRSW